jgi:hypothetical protein
MQTAWETELADFLGDLSEVQVGTLDILSRKRRMLADSNEQGLREIAGEEEGAMQRLQECMQRRQSLLEHAAAEGLPADSLQSLSEAISKSEKGDLARSFRKASGQTRLLRHQSVVNWVITQRTLIHLSQILEIIATRGRNHATYNGARHKSVGPTGGSLMDRVA